MAEETTPKTGDGLTLSDREPVTVPKSQVTVKTVATITAVVLGIAALAYLLVHSLVAITLTVAAALLAVALNRAVELLQRRGVGRNLSILLVMLALFAVIAGIFWLIVPAAAAQVQQLVEHAPEYRQKLLDSRAFAWVQAHVDVNQKIDQLKQQGGVQDVGQAALTALGGVAAALLAVVTVIFLVIFMLAFGGRLVRGVLAESLPAHRERYERVMGKIYHSVGGYLSGLGLIAILNGTLMTIFLAIIRVPFFLPLGLLSGLGSLIPLLGASVSGVLITLIALASKGPVAAIAVAIYVIVYQQFENHAVAPLIYKRTVQVNPLVTLLGIIFFTELAGLVGSFLAVPIIAAAQIVVRELLLLRRERLNLPLQGEVAPRPASRRAFWRPRHRPAES